MSYTVEKTEKGWIIRNKYGDQINRLCWKEKRLAVRYAKFLSSMWGGEVHDSGEAAAEAAPQDDQEG